MYTRTLQQETRKKTAAKKFSASEVAAALLENFEKTGRQIFSILPRLSLYTELKVKQDFIRERAETVLNILINDKTRV